jgi:hypothetical protein
MLVRIKQNVGNIYTEHEIKERGKDNQLSTLITQKAQWLQDHVGEFGNIPGEIQDDNILKIGRNIEHIPGYCLEYIRWSQ